MKKRSQILKRNQLNAEIEKVEKEYNEKIIKEIDGNIEMEEIENEIIQFDEIIRCATDVYTTLDIIDFAILEKNYSDRGEALKFKCFELMEYGINQLHTICFEPENKI